MSQCNVRCINPEYGGIRKATMEEKKYSNAKRAITIISLLTAFVAGFELFMAFSHYQPGMTICDVASHVSRDNFNSLFSASYNREYCFSACCAAPL